MGSGKGQAKRVNSSTNASTSWTQEYSNEELLSIEANMRPGQCSDVGFLSPTDDLNAIITADAATLASFNVTHEQLVTKLAELIDSAHQNNNTYETDELVCKLSGEYHLGFQECPYAIVDRNEKSILGFGDACRSDHHNYKNDYEMEELTIKNKSTGEEIFIDGQLLHLINDHHFFEGNNQYRVDPKKLCEILGL